MSVETEQEAKAKKQVLRVTVYAPRSPKPKKFEWSPQMTVGQAADEAAKAFGYAAGTPTLAKEGKPFERAKELGAVGVEDHDKLELVDVGGGV